MTSIYIVIIFYSLCSVVYGMSIDDNVLTKVLASGQTMLMWWRWLVDGPVVPWWVVHWVLKLSKSILLWGLFGNGDLIHSNSHLHAKIGITHSVSSDNWVHMDWDTLLLAEDLGGLSIVLLLEKRKFIWSNLHVHVELGISHSVSHNDWVDVDWHSLGEGLFVCDRILLHVYHNLSELSSDWSWLVSEKVLKGTSGDVGIEEG